MDAGADSTCFLQERITLNGSASVESCAAIGGQLTWSIQSGPPGHQAVLTGIHTAFPVLTADVAGEYVIELNLAAPGSGGLSDTCSVLFLNLQLLSHGQGSFDTSATLNVAAQLSGGLVSAFVVGDVAAVKAATDAGASAAGRIGEVISVQVIARPHDDLSIVLPAPVKKGAKKEAVG